MPNNQYIYIGGAESTRSGYTAPIVELGAVSISSDDRYNPGSTWGPSTNHRNNPIPSTIKMALL